MLQAFEADDQPAKAATCEPRGRLPEHFKAALDEATHVLAEEKMRWLTMPNSHKPDDPST